MKNVFHLPAYPIRLEHNNFPSALDKAEAFNDMFSENSLSENLHSNVGHKLQEDQVILEEPSLDFSHYLNCPIQFDEFIESLASFTDNNSAVGLDGISFQMLVNLPTHCKKAPIFMFPKMLEEWHSS